MIGVDVVDVVRLQRALERSPKLEVRLFTPAERAYCGARRNRAQGLAGTLAAKEAVIKALRLGPLPAWAQRIEVRRDRDGVPSAVVGDTEVAVSISHDGPVAVAVALAPPSR
jgi:holo-[acyl-carrier protein] synthase